MRWSALQESGASPPLKKIDDAVRLPLPWGAVQCDSVQWAPLHSRCAALRCAPAVAMERAPRWATGWGFRGHVRGALQCGFLAVLCVAKRTAVVPWAAWHLDLFVGRKKKSQGPDSNPRPSDPQPSTLTTRTQDLDASKVSIFIPWSAHGASSSRGLEEGGGRRPPRGRLQIRLSPNGGALHWRGAHWSVLLAACWLLHVGLFALPVAPRGAVRSVASSRGVVASMLVAGAASTMQDLLPSSCGLLQLGWGFVVRSGVGWGFPRGLWLCPDRVDRPPEMVSLSACTGEARCMCLRRGSLRVVATARLYSFVGLDSLSGIA